MNLCPNGHDKDTVGTVKRGCRQCKRDRNKAYARRNALKIRALEQKRRKPCTHSDECSWRVSRAGSVYCAAQRSFAGSDQGPRLDGFEDEFGPAPAPVPSAVWVDRVAIERWRKGDPVGRLLTLGEHRAIHLLSILRGGPGVREEAQELVSA